MRNSGDTSAINYERDSQQKSRLNLEECQENPCKYPVRNPSRKIGRNPRAIFWRNARWDSEREIIEGSTRKYSAETPAEIPEGTPHGFRRTSRSIQRETTAGFPKATLGNFSEIISKRTSGRYPRRHYETSSEATREISNGIFILPQERILKWNSEKFCFLKMFVGIQEGTTDKQTLNSGRFLSIK